MAKKREQKSERHPVGDNGSGHFVEFEYVPNADNAREMVPGYEVVDVGSNYDKVAVYFSARTVQ